MEKTERSTEEWQKQWMQDEGWGCGRDRELKSLGLTVAAINNLMDKIDFIDHEKKQNFPKNS